MGLARCSVWLPALEGKVCGVALGLARCSAWLPALEVCPPVVLQVYDDDFGGEGFSDFVGTARLSLRSARNRAQRKDKDSN